MYFVAFVLFSARHALVFTIRVENSPIRKGLAPVRKIAWMDMLSCRLEQKKVTRLTQPNTINGICYGE